MIKLESVHIEEVRGIRNLDIEFHGKTFAISGPNGSGKSGVIDAIEFGLTGQIGRLMGRGTKGLTVAEHGPHVDRTKFPDAAFVVLKVSLPALKKTATITRKVSAPKKPKVEPNDADVLAALAEIADHPEITLSRREILRFILIEPTKRSDEIQTILKLEKIGQTRNALNTAQNRLGTTARHALTQANTNRDLLLRHLQLSALRAEDILAAVNQRRALLGLTPIEKLTADSKLDAGLSASSKPVDFNKMSALLDVAAFTDATKSFADLGCKEAATIVSDLAALEADPALLIALQRAVFVQKGLELVDGPECPLCDTEWDDEQHLRDHLKSKLAKSEEARTIQQRLLKNGGALVQHIVKLGGVLDPVHKAATASGDTALAGLLQAWKEDVTALKDKLGTIDGLAGLKDRLTTGWLSVPKTLAKSVTALAAAIEGRPDQTATIDAQTFPTTAQLRLGDYREAMRASKAAEHAATLAKSAYHAYCGIMEDELNTLRGSSGRFQQLLPDINEDDEATFSAKLTPGAGKLDLDVNFYERGLFPPGAYHSEGHQDGMGVCLYLALMKRLMGNGFSFALLDDVVMSVDVGHRYQFCKLLKTYFPHTQFVITTHDRLWAEQMRSAGLASSASSLAFHSWTIDTGPLVESNAEIWDEIAAMLGRGKVEAASHALRHHLEYVSRHLADQLGAAPTFRADGNYELGELLPSVLARMKHLYGRVADAAQSWGNASAKEAAAKRKEALASSNAATNVEQWVVNKAVHYNEWANFGKKDFEPVVAAFKELLECFHCDKCQSWLRR
jgi:RecF/RecN/SMC N terminal domain